MAFKGLLPSDEEDYKLVAVLMDKTTGSELLQPDGTPVTAEVIFSPKESEGTVDVTFSLEGCEIYAGKTIVAFETLYYKDEEVAEHKDINDSDQSVVFPVIGTTLTAENGTHVSYPCAFGENGSPADLKLTDTVDYENLIPDITYTLEGILMDRKTGQPYRDSNANHVTSSVSFIPDQPDGQIQLEFVITPDRINKEVLEENALVAFESLYQDERKVAEHADIQDEEQSIHFPSIRTSARSEDGTHTALLENDASEVTLTDTVTYRNLVPGLRYKLIGTLMDCKTHGILRQPDGSPIVAEKEFVPEQQDGSVDVVFSFDAKNVAGKKAVVFESLMIGQTLIAEHKDIEDEEQMIQFPHLVRVFKYDASDRHGLGGAEFRIEDKDAISELCQKRADSYMHSYNAEVMAQEIITDLLDEGLICYGGYAFKAQQKERHSI